jgi:hypothetical protein
MTAVPRPPGECDPGGAADSESGLEHRIYGTSAAPSQSLVRLRQQRVVERVCKIPRLVAELLSEIGCHHGIEDDIAARLDRYATVDHDLLAALGADRFPASPIWQIWGRP